MDCLPEDQPEGSYRHAQNIVLSKLNNAVANEEGFEYLGELPVNPIYVLPVDNGEYIIFGTYDIPGVPNGGSQIGRLSNDGAYTRVLSSGGLEFNNGAVFKAVYMRNFKGQLIIAWTNSKSSPRILNIDELPFPASAMTTHILNRPDLLVLTELYPRFNPYIIENKRHVDSGGQLLSGTYFLAVSYETPDGSRTNWGTIAGPFHIADELSSRGANSFDGAPAGSPTSKCIEIEIGNIDTRYRYFNIAVVKRIGGNYSAALVGKKLVTGTREVYTYTGSEIESPLILEEVLADSAYYKTAKSIAMLDNRLHLANLTTDEQINYQKYANNIKVEWITDEVSLNTVKGSYKDSVVLFNKKGFFPDETYALYISLILDANGARTSGFHIPGRAPSTIDVGGVQVTENDKIQDILDANPSLHYLNHDLMVDKSIRYFHTRETALEDGTMGFWENETETYPDHPDWDIVSKDGTVGTLRNQKVRHHKMPGMDMLVKKGIITERQLSDLGYTKLIYKNSKDKLFQDPKQVNIDLQGLNLLLTNSPLPKGSWDPSTATYTALQEHTFVLDGSYTMAASSSTEEGTNDPCYSIVSLEVYSIKGGVAKEEYYDSWTDEDIRAEDGYSGATNVHISNTVKKSIHLLPGEKVQLHATVSAAGTYWSYNVDINLAMWLGEYTGIEEVVSNQGVGISGKVLGFKLSNIYIPEEIRSRIRGFEIYYAKRTSSNMRVVGNSALFHYQTKHALYEENKGPSIGNMTNRYGATLDFTTARFHAFDLLRNMAVVAPSYLKVGMQMIQGPIPDTGFIAAEGDSVPDDTTPLQSGYLANFLQPGVAIQPIDEAKSLRTIANFSYIPGDTVVNVEGEIMDNTWGEEHAFFNIRHLPGEETAWFTDSGLYSPSNYAYQETARMAMLYQHRINMYTSMFNQELVSTGTIILSTGMDTYQVDRVFGGDCTMNRYGIRLTAPLYISETRKSTNKFEAIKAVYMFPVYSASNIDLRHEGKALHEAYFPKVGVGTDSYFKWLKRAADAPNSNTFLYNDDYSSLNDLNKVYPYNSQVEYTDRFPFRIVRSKPYNAENKEFTFRTFLPFDYYEMVKNRGEIVNIEAFGDILFINTKSSVFRTVGTESLKTTTTEITLGAGDIFRMPPKELITSEGGYAGCQHLSSCFVSKLGYFFVDAEQGKVFMVNADLKEISNQGMRNWFMKNCNYLNVPDTDDQLNQPGKAGFTVAYDEKFNRLILAINGKESGYTLSYSPDREAWTSFHSYLPGIMRNTRKSLVSFIGNKAFRHNVEGVPGKYYDATYPSFMDVVFNPYPDMSKLFATLQWRTRVEDASGNPKAMETFSRIMVMDSRHCSGIVDIVPMFNTRSAEGEWRFNDFRDMVKDHSLPFMNGIELDPSNIDPEKPWYKQGRFIDNYLIVRIIEDNVKKNTIYLYSIDTNYRVSDR